MSDITDTVTVSLGNKGKKPKSVLNESDSEYEEVEKIVGLRLIVDDIAVDEDELDTTVTVACHLTCEDITPLHFWKDHAACFPKLQSITARSVLAIRASQHKTEHSFSAMLDPQHLDEQLLIRSHHKTKPE